MIDIGSVASLVTKRMARETKETHGNAWWNHTTNRTQLRSSNDSPIQNLGTLYCEIESNGWNGCRVDLIVVPNNHRALIGRDLFGSLEISLSQMDSNSDKSNGKQIKF